MKFKFSEQTTYNVIGSNSTRQTAQKGDVRDLPGWLCRLLGNKDKGKIVKAEPTEQPTAEPQEQKATYTLRSEGAGWYSLIDEDGQAADKIRGKEKAQAKLEELNG